ncbi:MFS transporter [Aliarcobacter skirrowii]|uniref:MFS transporter n=1 Tax=Aliarcobacter skirrowii TaxID=28200 RepID=A0A2U2BZ34_9BACT|nr:MFS transporter [Aliarcobacter skirrowii]MDX3959614.1 MFS transporter [Aliarcobacter skirrowii]MDX4066212.1 MFS transporter [Aliarcobacter skirrowii]MDX4067958.1 MFS transporter [Aliarcobacter skirrowii]PWE20026.1 MFS transporter [Aliarcobacter skirrowii]
MKNLKTYILPISSLFLSITFLAIGYGIMITYIGVYLKQAGVSSFSIGLINSAFFLGAIASSIFSQKIISTIGHIRSFASFAALMVIAFLLHSVYLNEFFWGFLRLISGFSFYALLIIVESWLNEKSSNSQRGQILAIYTIIFYLSTALGQLFLTIPKDSEFFVFTVGSVLVLFSLITIAMTKIKEPILKPFEQYSFPKLYSIVPLALTGSFIGGFFVGSFFTMLPLTILHKFDSTTILSIFMSLTLIGGLVSQWPIGKLSDKYGRRKLIAFCGFFTAFVSLLFIIVPELNSYYYILALLLGVTIFAIYPLSLARANDVLDENKDMVEISRALLFAYGAGSFIAPIILGIIFTFLNYEAIFFIYLTIGFFLGLYSLSRKRVADDDMSVFVNFPVTSGPVVAQLDPRQD